MNKIKRELKCMNKIKKIIGHCLKIKLMQIK